MPDKSDFLPPAGKIFYGWWIVAAGVIILFASSGVGFYCHGVILDPLGSKYGWSKGTISTAVSMFFLVTGLFGILIGKKIDTYGPKPFLILGALVFSGAYLLLGHIQEVWQLFILYFFLAIGWTGISLIPISTLITNWFIRKRGFAMSLTMTGLSLGGMVMVPLSSYLLQVTDFNTTVTILGCLISLVIIPCAAILVKSRPSDLNLLPDGDSGIEPGLSSEEESKKQISQILKTAKKVLQEAIILQGTTFSDYVNTNNQSGNFQNKLRVYRQQGQSCYNCGAKIIKDKISGRGTYYCSSCQK